MNNYVNLQVQQFTSFPQSELPETFRYYLEDSRGSVRIGSKRASQKVLVNL